VAGVASREPALGAMASLSGMLVTMPHLFDTQLVSYAINGTIDLPSSEVAISSTTAQELLLMQGGSPTRNNYYLPRLVTDEEGWPAVGHYVRSLSGRHRRFAGKSSTDRLVLDFGPDYPTVVEYSHRTLADALNDGNYELIEGMAQALRPDRHRVVVRRLRFHCAHNITCVPLSRKSTENGLRLFHAFVANFELKGRFRNSLNDILTLAIAEANSSSLHTNDQLLGKFAMAYADVPVNRKEERITIDFAPTTSPRRQSRGLKGYVNCGWQVRV
jgi:hypothetical protein